MTLSQQALERVTIEAYLEFERGHKDLLRTNPQEYWSQSTDFKERKLQEYKIANGHYAEHKSNGGGRKW